MVDHRGIQVGHARVRIVLSLHRQVRLEKKVRFSPTEEFVLTFKYERLLGRCRQCARIDHVGAVCPETVSAIVTDAAGPSCSLVTGSQVPPMVFRANIPQVLSSSLLSNLKFAEVFRKERREVVIRSLPETPVSEASEPLRITGVVRAREDAIESGTKRSRHALDLVPQVLLPENLGMVCAEEGLVEVSVSIAGERKRSRGRPRGSRNKPKVDMCPSSPTSSVSAFSDGAMSLSSAGKGNGPMA